jgi:two-component system, cell cycle sensor histidine kinase PleC
VLDLSKVISGQLDLDEATVDLGPLLRECVELMQGDLAERRLTLHTAIAVGNLSLTADGVRLKQALLNLLSNAVKFSCGGDAVEMRAEFTDNDLTIAITDQGVGMMPEHIPIALEPFRHINGDPLRAYNGASIGLPLAKMLIEKHGGTLNVTSELGEGTTVSVTLPGWRVNRESVAPALEVA